MKVVLVNVWLDAERGGGTAERTRCLALHLARQDCACTIVTMGPTPWLAEFTRANVKVLQVRYIGERFPIPLLDPRALFRVIREADVVQVMGFWFLLAALSCFVAHYAGTLLALCPAGSLTRFGRSSRVKKLFFATLGRAMLKLSDTVIATTEQEKQLLASDLGVARGAIFVSPNGIEPYRGEIPTDDHPIPGRLITFVGRLTAIKAPDLLLEAFAPVAAALADVTLVIAGPDLGLRPQLERRVAELGLQSRVRFTGFLDERQRTALLGQTTLLVVPSHSEVMSMVALEAGAMGVPVLLTDQCGFDEVAEIGGGLVVGVDQHALTAAIQQIMTDENAVERMGNRLRTFVLANYAWEKVVGKLRHHFDTLRST